MTWQVWRVKNNQLDPVETLKPCESERDAKWVANCLSGTEPKRFYIGKGKPEFMSDVVSTKKAIWVPSDK